MAMVSTLLTVPVNAADGAVDGDVLAGYSPSSIVNFGGHEYKFKQIGMIPRSMVIGLTAAGEIYKISYSTDSGRPSPTSQWERFACTDNRTFQSLPTSLSGKSESNAKLPAQWAVDMDGNIIDISTPDCPVSKFNGSFKHKWANGGFQTSTVDDTGHVYGSMTGSNWNAAPVFDNVNAKSSLIADYGSSPSSAFFVLDEQGTSYVTTKTGGVYGKLVTLPSTNPLLSVSYITGVRLVAADSTGVLESLTMNGTMSNWKWQPYFTGWPKVRYATSDTSNVFAIAGDPSTPQTHTLTFDLNGAPGTAPAVQTLDSNGVTAKPEDPVWSGHVFLGWYTDAGDEFTFGRPLTGDVTVYAHWQKNPGATIACAPQTGDPAASIWQTITYLIGGLTLGMAFIALRLRRRIRRRV